MKMFCNGWKFLLDEGDSFSMAAASFLNTRAGVACGQSIDWRRSMEKVKITEWKHNHGIKIEVNSELWTVYCNHSFLPHLNFKYDMHEGVSFLYFDFRTGLLRAGDFFQTKEGIIGDAFFGFLMLFVLGRQPEVRESVFWPMAEFDLSKIRAAREEFVSVASKVGGVTDDGMLLGLVSNDKFFVMAEDWMVRFSENQQCGIRMNSLLRYLHVPEMAELS